MLIGSMLDVSKDAEHRKSKSILYFCLVPFLLAILMETAAFLMERKELEEEIEASEKEH
jgi:hypothetical protein